MDRKIRVGAVSYLNTLPLVYGLKKEKMKQAIDLSFHYPSNVARELLENRVDIGLVPVAVIPELEEAHIISQYCIGASGPVASVCIFSEVPLHELTHIYLDYQSKTSVSLARVLLKEYWQHDVIFLRAEEGFIEKIGGTTGAVIIGDRALRQVEISSFKYDLAEAWQKHTGLPFVFAAWVANKTLPADFISLFDVANGEGFHHLDEIIREINFPGYDLMKYYTSDIDYRLDDKKLAAIRLFHEKLRLLPPHEKAIS